MLTGIGFKFAQPLAAWPTKGASGGNQNSFIMRALKELALADIPVVFIVGDGAANNAK